MLCVKCYHYNIVRLRYFSISTLTELFEAVDGQSVLDFIKEIGFYYCI